MSDLTRAEAYALVGDYLASVIGEEEGEFSIVDDATLETSFGWVFFYDTAEYLRTGDEMARAVGNAPLIVDRRTGKLHVTGTGQPVEHYVAMYETFGTCHPD